MTPAPAEVPAPPAVPAPVVVAVPDVPPAPVAVDTAEVPSAPPRRRLWLATGAVAAVAASLVAGFLLGNGGTTSSGGQASDAKPRADVASPSAAPEANTLQDGEDAETPDGTDGGELPVDSTFEPGYVFVPPAASSDCVLPKKTDTTGQYFTYEPENAIDKLSDTAWRCDQRTGRLALAFSEPTQLTHVGLIPGYTKTDPDGTDWFYKNLTVKKARWTFYLEGQEVAQYTEVIDEPDESMQWITFPSAVVADTASIDVIETGNPDAHFPYIAISGIGLSNDV
ncbi:hypothetical protein [Streptomyces sp. NPDC059378]|uniref:hypothetical protein n=1 Tax=Streptomyces sp. NPDC059378 TaxID=3346815 RepID=UPI0036C6978D